MKAQVSAPIELLIGVIILTMVMVVAYFTLENMQAGQQQQKIKASISKFSNDLETVYAGAVGTRLISSLDFTAAGFKGDIKSVKFVYGSKEYCMANVGISNCYVLVALGETVTAGELTREAKFVQVLKIPTSFKIVYSNKDIIGCDAVIQSLDEVLAPQVSGFQDTNCFQWKSSFYSLNLEKTDANTIQIS